MRSVHQPMIPQPELIRGAAPPRPAPRPPPPPAPARAGVGGRAASHEGCA